MGGAISLTRAVIVLLVLVCLTSAVQAAIIYVPDNYTKIQWAINNASNGDTIIVRDGIYYENLVINKNITLKSENGSANCIIDGGNSGSVIVINADGVTIEGFTIRNSSSNSLNAGIKICSNNNSIKNNSIENNSCGIHLLDSSNNSIVNNTISNNDDGIYLLYSSNNIIKNNTFINDGVVIMGKLQHWIHTIENNTVNGKPLYYFKDIVGGKVPKDAGQVILVNCTGMIIENLTINNTDVGILLGFSSQITIKNNNIENNVFGIHLYESSNNSIVNNTISNNKNGIYLSNSSNNIIENNNISNNNNGICLLDSSNNSIVNNTISNKIDGIYLLYSSNNSIKNNTFINDGVVIMGKLQHWIHTIENNTVNGKPLYYFKDIVGGKVPKDAGQVILVNCTGMIIENLTINNTDVGILLGFSSQITIRNNTISNNYKGIHLWKSSNNSIINNKIISNNGWCGIHLYKSSNNSIINNDISSNYLYGIELRISSNNIIKNNNISNNGWCGIHLYKSSNNKIYLNNFINNKYNVKSKKSTNIWNSTEEITYTYNGVQYTNYLGNYWNDYKGSDANGDGIGDTPYQINSNNSDYHPLMKPFENYAIVNILNLPPEIAIEVPDLIYLYDGDSTNLQINITVHDPNEDNISKVKVWMIYPNNTKIKIEEKSNIKSFSFNFSENVSIKEVGTYVILVLAEDERGKVSYKNKSFEVRINWTIPQVKIEVPNEVELSYNDSTGNYKVAQVNINISVSDTLPHLERVNITVYNLTDGGVVYKNTTNISEPCNSTSYNFTVSISKPAEYLVYVEAYDGAGNIGRASKIFTAVGNATINETVNQTDNTVEVADNVEFNFTVTNNTTVEISFEKTTNVSVFNVSLPKINVTECYNFSLNVDTNNVSVVNITINLTKLGLSNPVVWIFKKDKGWYNITDYNRGGNNTTIINNNKLLIINLTNVGRALGYENNITDFYEDPIVALGVNDTKPPQLTLTADNTSVTIGDKITFTLTSNEPLQNATIYIYWSNGTLHFNASMVKKNETTFTYTWTTNAIGNFIVNATAYDKAGNRNVSGTLNITVSEVPTPQLKPDLTISEIRSNKNVIKVNEKCIIYVTVENRGTMNAQNFNVSLYINGKEIRKQVGLLMFDNSTTITFEWTPQNAGTYTIYAVVDPDGKIDELDETNNRSSTTIEVKVVREEERVGRPARGFGGGYVVSPTPTPPKSELTPTPKLTPEITPTPKITPTPTATPTPAITPKPTPTPTPTPTPKPWWKIPGFELAFAIIALLAVAYILRKR